MLHRVCCDALHSSQVSQHAIYIFKLFYPEKCLQQIFFRQIITIAVDNGFLRRQEMQVMQKFYKSFECLQVRKIFERSLCSGQFRNSWDIRKEIAGILYELIQTSVVDCDFKTNCCLASGLLIKTIIINFKLL